MRIRQSLKPVLTDVALAICWLVSPGAQAQDSPIFRHSAAFFKFEGAPEFKHRALYSQINVCKHRWR